MTQADLYMIKNIDETLQWGYRDVNPRPRYQDGTPAHTISLNHRMRQYNLAQGDFPITGLRPIAWKSAIKEILWIYQDASNSLEVLNNKYGVRYWNDWESKDIPGTIGIRYGETVRRHDLMNKLLKDKANQGIAWGRKNYLLQDYPDLVFTTSYGNPLPPSDAWKYCSQGVNRINEEEVIAAVVQNREPQLLTLHPHVFRHTFATECMDQGMNPKVLIKILGHSNMQMLNRYTHANTERIVEEFNRCRVKTV